MDASGLPCRSHTRRLATLETHSGARDVQICELETLHAGDVQIEGLRMVEVAWPTTIARTERGLLPASVFERAHVSAARGIVTVWER
jgi:hypothetical protein